MLPYLLRSFLLVFFLNDWLVLKHFIVYTGNVVWVGGSGKWVTRKCFPLSLKLSGECVGSNSSEAWFLNTSFALCSLRSRRLLYFPFLVVFLFFIHLAQLLYDDSSRMEEEYPSLSRSDSAWSEQINLWLRDCPGPLFKLYCCFVPWLLLWCTRVA